MKFFKIKQKPFNKKQNKKWMATDKTIENVITDLSLSGLESDSGDSSDEDDE